MTRNTIPPEVLRMAGGGEVGALRRLGRLVTPGTATAEILDIIFKHLATVPVPASSSVMSQLLSGTGVGNLPSACMCVFWKILRAGDDPGLKPEIQASLVDHLFELGDVVLGWTRLCLQSGLPTVTDDMLKTDPISPRAKRYLTAAHMLERLLGLNSDYAVVILSSPAFLDRSDHTGSHMYRMLDSRAVFGCPILTVAEKILSDDFSTELLLARCGQSEVRQRFASALTDRVLRGWDYDKVPMLGWNQSLKHLLAISVQLSKVDRRFHRILSRTGHLMHLCGGWATFSRCLLVATETKFLVIYLLQSLGTLIDFALHDETSSRVSSNVVQLKLGHYVEALFNATLVLGRLDSDRDGVRLLDSMLSVLRKLGQCMMFPHLFWGLEITNISAEKLAHLPEAIQPWTRLLEAHNRSTKAFTVLETRPAVYICNYLACALTGRELGNPAKTCSACASVVYCSVECQKRDWEELHREECPRASQVHADLRASRTWYSHEIMAYQASLLEIIYNEECVPELDESRTIYPVFDCVFKDGTLEVTKEGVGIAERNTPRHWPCPLPPQPRRLDSLLEANRLGIIPSDWRLVEGIFPRTVGGGDDCTTIRLLCLLKPTSDGYRSVYSFAQ
ncbi:hypothetical protein FA13DRAFT_1735715 [Coprinellus micaceus]|uniref:MYND-type domain-containing protein n=1 Tax=Coprinellus micaceus TaxID=71717 RepID=A0A4Y7T446_COPMI|nr:hypothetical protein FA13DRAFT_1735715 [Coprinellus micaceus]